MLFVYVARAFGQGRGLGGEPWPEPEGEPGAARCRADARLCELGVYLGPGSRSQCERGVGGEDDFRLSNAETR